MRPGRALLLSLPLLCLAVPASAEDVPARACTGQNCMEDSARPAQECEGENCAQPPSQGMTDCTGQDCDAIKPDSGPEIETVEPQAAQ